MSLQVGEILRIVATMVWLDGNLNMNVFNSVITGSGGPFDEADVVADMVAWVTTMYNQLTTVTVDELDGSQVQVYEYDSGDDDWDEIGSGPWSWNPSVAADQLPRGVACLINAKTLNADVSGKKYLGGTDEGHITDGLWVGSQIAAVTDFADEWITPFVGGVSGATHTPAVWSVVKGQVYPFTGTYIIPTIPAYQRRRKRGVGV